MRPTAPSAWTSGTCSDRNRSSLRAVAGQETPQEDAEEEAQEAAEEDPLAASSTGPLGGRSLRATAPFRVRPLGVVALFAIGLAACGGPAAPDLSGSRAVTFESRDGVVLEGRLFGDGSTAVVLSHMRPDRPTVLVRVREPSRRPGLPGAHLRLPRAIAPAAMADARRAICRSRRSGRTCSARWTSCARKGRRASRSSGPAWEEPPRSSRPGRRDPTPEAVVTLSAPDSIEGLNADAALLQRVAANKLFIAGVGDAAGAASAEHLYEIAPPPKRHRDRPRRRPRDRPADGLAGRSGPTADRDLPRAVRAGLTAHGDGAMVGSGVPSTGPGYRRSIAVREHELIDRRPRDQREQDDDRDEREPAHRRRLAASRADWARPPTERGTTTSLFRSPVTRIRRVASA